MKEAVFGAFGKYATSRKLMFNKGST